MDITNDPKYVNFVESKDLRDKTISLYTMVLKTYCEFHGETPSELIKEARDDQEEYSWVDDRKINDRLLKFKSYLENKTALKTGKKLSFETKKAFMRIVKSFYYHYEIQLPRITVKQKDKHDRQTIEDIPKKEHILKALDLSNLKYRAIITLMASSGMAQTDVRHLTVKNLYTALDLPVPKNFPLDVSELTEFIGDNPHYCPIFHLTRIKTSIDYTTFCTPEALRFIVNYMAYVSKKKPYMSEDEVLFKDFSPIEENACSTVTFYFRRINNIAGFGNNRSGKSVFFSSHKLRKFFTSVLYKNNVPELSIHWYLGHKVPSNTEAYFKMSVKTHRKEYERLVPYLTFTENVRRIETDSKTLTEMAEQIAELRQKVEEQDEIIRSGNIEWAENKMKELEEAYHKKD